MSRRYNALRNVPWQVMADIRDRIEALPNSNEKTILRMYFVWNLSPRQIIERCEQYNIRSRNKTFYTTRSIQNICKKYFPDVAQYRKPNKYKELRREHMVFIRTHKKERCEKCGSKENLVWHHKTPLCMGGKTCKENMECLCRGCHIRVHSGL